MSGLVTVMHTATDGSGFTFEFTLLNGSNLRRLLPPQFETTWSRQDHERIVANGETYLAETQASSAAKMLLGSQMAMLFATAGVDSITVRTTTNDDFVTVLVHAGPEQDPRLEEICGRATTALTTFDRSVF